MNETCIVAADGARARVFTLTRPEQPEFEGGPDLLEVATLTAPTHAARDSAVYTDGLTGRNRAPGSTGHDYDEHRDAHDDEVERRFAREIVEVMKEQAAQRNIVCAEKRMLGFLRDALSGHQAPTVTEVSKDLVRLGPRDLQAQLADEGLVPRRKPPQR